MTAPYYAPGDQMLAFLLRHKPHMQIEKIAGVVKEQWCGALLLDSEHYGTRHFVINGWIQCAVHAEAKFGEGIFSRLHFDPDDMRYWHPYNAVGDYAERVPWIDQNTHGLWCVYTRETIDEVEKTANGDPKMKRECFIGFENDTDAIHYKLRWIG